VTLNPLASGIKVIEISYGHLYRKSDAIQGETSMRHLTIAVATVAIAALAAAVPASAQEHPLGGPIKSGSQCWKSHVGADAAFGTFEACPQGAATPTPRRTARHRG
jgi:hypothetical protein